MRLLYHTNLHDDKKDSTEHGLILYGYVNHLHCSKQATASIHTEKLPWMVWAVSVVALVAPTTNTWQTPPVRMAIHQGSSSSGAPTESPFFLVLTASSGGRGFETAPITPAPPIVIPSPVVASPWLVHPPAAAAPPATTVPLVDCSAPRECDAPGSALGT